ncbi:uncharacterized protein [Acropora muricata]|uniref:uncharacterized protein n=1 Tax=Acropora muricata TaxID=159855 RepID=UPI0034E5B075
MSSLVTVVLKTTLGFIVRKGRDAAADKLKEGDVTALRFRDLIVREIDAVKSKLDGLARRDLLAAIDFFEEGIVLLHEVVQSNISSSSNGVIDAIRALELNELKDESSQLLLSNSKKRFEDARRKATEAFNDEALKPSDRVLAMGYRIMATVLEMVGNPSAALSSCQMCIERLNSLPVVQNCFAFEVKKHFRSRFSKQERRDIISETCRLNRIIYDITVMTRGFGHRELPEILSSWPCVEVDDGNDTINPLLDPKVLKCLRKQGLQTHSCLPWTFGQEGSKEQTLNRPCGITANSMGYFIVTDYKDGNVKLFDNNGNFLSSFRPVVDDVTGAVLVHDVATDVNDNIYVLVTIEDHDSGEMNSFVFLKTPNDMFSLKKGFTSSSWTWSSLAISSKGKILVRGVLVDGKHAVDIYETDGRFVRRFGEKELDISSAVAGTVKEGVLVATEGRACYRVNLFNQKGKRVGQFQVDKTFHDPQMTCHKESGNIVVAGVHLEGGNNRRLEVVILNQGGEFVRNIEHEIKNLISLRGITVTVDGRIALVCGDNVGFKVFVV